MSDWHSRWKQVAWYDYADPDGVVRFAHVRWASRHRSGLDPKTKRAKCFTYRTATFDPSTGLAHPRSMWSIGLNVEPAWRHLPYRLPDLVQVSRRDGMCPHVVICEGEKDADAVRSLGWCATTSHGGAAKWTTNETDWLAGIRWFGDVWIAIDRDDAGWLHARATLEALAWEWPIKCVRAREGKDAHDAIVGHGLGENWWELVPVDIAIARANKVERKLRAAGEGVAGQGLLNGYRIDVAGWKQRELNELIAKEDW